MKIVIIDTSIPINTRNVKIAESLKYYYPDSEIFVISWNRDNYKGSLPIYYKVYNKVADYGKPIQKLLKLYGYKRFLIKEITLIQPDIIIASHWDSLLICPSNLQNKPMLIYENLDIPTGNFIIRKTIRIFELWKLKKINLIIHASRFFKELYPSTIPQIILENKSTFSFNNVKPNIGKQLTFSYIGNVRYRDILENFLTAATSFDSINIKIFGSGKDLNYLKDKFEKKNVCFYGAYNFSEIPQIYAQSDVVWAAYPNKDYNVIYAISNKFHESSVCGVPCIYAENTKLGEFVNDNGIGFIVNPYSVESIKKVISNIIKNKSNLSEYRNRLITMGRNETSWNDDFRKIVNTIDDFFNLKE